MNLEITERANKFLAKVPEKDLRIIKEHIERLLDHPHSHGDIKRLKTKKERYRMHVSYRYTIFYYPHGESIIINEIMTTEQAHKEYGRV